MQPDTWHNAIYSFSAGKASKFFASIGHRNAIQQTFGSLGFHTLIWMCAMEGTMTSCH